MADLTTAYMGLRLDCPLVASATPLAREIDQVHRLEEAGAGALVLYSLFEEQFSSQPGGQRGAPTRPAAAASEPFERDEFLTRPHEYLEHLARLRREVSMPLLASVSVARLGHWLDFAGQLEQAGADGIELSLYRVACDPFVSSAAVEAGFVELCEALCARVQVPVAVKLPLQVTAPASLGQRLERAGARSLVLFHRFCQPDIDIERRRFVTDLDLSTAGDASAVLNAISLLRPHVDLSLAASGGMHSSTDAVAAIMVGADVVMMCSALLRHGVEHLGRVRSELSRWLEEHDIERPSQIRAAVSLSQAWRGKVRDNRVPPAGAATLPAGRAAARG